MNKTSKTICYLFIQIVRVWYEILNLKIVSENIRNYEHYQEKSYIHFIH